jgi:Arc/MetJ-type ribon-helix-helix transcriptional regulator
MKSKISITLSGGALRRIEAHVGEFKSRSDLVEAAVERFIAHLERKRIEQRDVEIINRLADKLNAEAEDVLGYQAPL